MVDRPVRVALDAVGIDASAQPVGVAADGQMELPPDPDDLGWYRHGPAPGDPFGSAVFGGHLDSFARGIGQLSRLRRTEVGDLAVVTTAAGAVRRYKVVEVGNVPRADAALEGLFRRGGDEQIVLITCGGEYDPDRGGYQENLVVTAVPT